MGNKKLNFNFFSFFRFLLLTKLSKYRKIINMENEDRIFELEAEYFKALSHPTRIKIIYLLKDGESCLCDLIPEMGKDESHIARHLAVLKRANIISVHRRGISAYYKLNDPTVIDIIEKAKDIISKQINELKDILK